MKKRLSALLVVLIVLSFASSVLAANTDILVGGKNSSITTELKSGRTFISASSLKDFGLTVTESGKNVTVKNKEVTMVFTLDSNRVKVNNSSFNLDSISYKKANSLYLPFRFIFETLNYNVSWNSSSKKISIDKNKDPSYPVSFNNSGTNYKINEEPNTIVSLAPDVTETLFAIGAGGKVKGRTKYCNYPAEVVKIKEVGSLYEPNIETVIDISPELVIAATHFKEDVLNKFKQAGINVFAKDSPSTLNDMYDNTLVLGNITNRNYEARALVSSMKSKVQTVELFTSNIKDKPALYFVVGTGEYGEFTHGNNTFVNDIILASGAKNIASDVSGYKYTLEKLIDKNPMYIFGPKFAYDTMSTSPNYSSLKAIKADRFITINEDIFARPSQRLVDQGLKVILKEIHPSVYKKIDF